MAAIRENCTETTGKALTLLGALRDTDRGGALVGPLVIVRTPESLVCGVLPLAELLRPGGPAAGRPGGTAARLRRLPRGRFCEAP